MSAPPVLPRPPRGPAVPTPLRYTVAEFLDAAERGAFGDRKVMLIRGEVVEMAAMKEPHYHGVYFVSKALEAAFGPGHFVRSQAPLDCDRTDPEPDVAVVPGGPRDYKVTPVSADARLVVEVADTSLDYDLTTKAELYAEKGVPDYWILDLIGGRLVVLRDPAPVAAGGHSYRSQQSFGPADSVAPLAAPGSPVRVADLLP